MKLSSNVKILSVSKTEDDRIYMEDFFSRTPFHGQVDFVVGKLVPADKYDFIVFDGRTAPVYKVEDYSSLPDDVIQHFGLLDRYIENTSKSIVFFGRYYHRLNYERCAPANSKFSLFARIREMIDFLNNYKSEDNS